MKPTIIIKITTGSKKTHNTDGRFTRAWRLWSDGKVERTNSKSKYQECFDSEKPPVEIIEAAKAAGIELKPGRQDWRRLPRKPAQQAKTETIQIRLTERQAEALRKNAEAEELTRTDYVIKRCCE